MRFALPPRPPVPSVLRALVLACGVPLASAAQVPAPPQALGVARQLVLVTTPAWDATSGTLRRYERGGRGGGWHAVGSPVSVVVGRSGLGFDPAAPATDSAAPRKQEGDGRSPAGVFPLTTAFGFAARPDVPWARLPYVPLTAGTECVDDPRSSHYNTIVDRAAVARPDWQSAERMREVTEYTLGVVVGYNERPAVPGRGSCVFLHVWGGPGTTTAGCTAMNAGSLEEVVHWLDAGAHPVLVQLPESTYARVRSPWRLP